MPGFHHRKLPEGSGFLSGRGPLDPALGFPSDRLQIYWRRGDDLSVDERPHAHLESDECFIVLTGSVVVEVEGREHVIGPREFCCFAPGVFHRIARLAQPVEALILRAPGRADKVRG
jgi:mannose-6-phosphate isomerase-like protein (cupin superfamily)